MLIGPGCYKRMTNNSVSGTAKKASTLEGVPKLTVFSPAFNGLPSFKAVFMKGEGQHFAVSVCQIAC